jgi:hypothetical protein
MHANPNTLDPPVRLHDAQPLGGAVPGVDVRKLKGVVAGGCVQVREVLQV